MREGEHITLHGLSRNRRGVDAVLWCMGLICGCFTLTSESYIEWLYRLIELSPSGGADWHALVGNYALQGVGMLLAAVHMRRRSRPLDTPLLLSALVLHTSFVVPASLASSQGAAIVFGSLMALCSGFIQAYYLVQLALLVEPDRRGVTFGVGYACSSGLTWLLSLARNRMRLPLSFGLVTCAVFTVATVALVVLTYPTAYEGTSGEDCSPGDEEPVCEVPEHKAQTVNDARDISALACTIVLLMSIEKSLGFGFPPADIVLGVSVEFSRLFYATGLVAAGIAMDYSRSYGVVCGMAAMVTPFALLALSGEPVPSTTLWSLDYLLYGFFALFRVILFLDAATRWDKVYLACFGLMLGRFGDAAGNALRLSLQGDTVALVVLAGIALVCSIPIALQLFPCFYAPEPTIVYQPTIVYREAPRTSEESRFSRFAQYFDLSRREQEVLRQVLSRHTNAEAAEELVVSESTIKFHMRNLLRKTGCKTRVELRGLYTDWQ